ncbi:unnamed protein product [Wuchereria bancrofti]|uniref:Uncharacterized protein n=2 Tax=Wuchereria bancrofti TaxID=6293 RepID=A0A3P7EIJ0_WUCBA|nr:unnamed protein product [Wuchereria bancrofti]
MIAPNAAPLQPLREKRDIRDYDPSIIRIEFKKTLCPNKSQKRSKQLELWKMITVASYYEKLMNSTRSRNVRQAVVYIRELDAAANRINSTIETLDQITNEVNNEIGCYTEDFTKSWITETDALKNNLYQLSIQLQKQQKAINNVANHFSRSIKVINGMNDNLREHKSLLKKCRIFDINILALIKLVRLQSRKMVASAKEHWSVEDLKTLPLAIDELNKVVINLGNLRTACKLIAPTSLPDEKDIANLIHQA